MQEFCLHLKLWRITRVHILINNERFICIETGHDKYYTQKDDFVVECKICNNNSTFSINRYMNYHMKTKHLDKLKNAQETHGTVDSSERVSSLKTDKTSKLISAIKDCYVLLKRYPPYNIYI